MDKTVTNVGRNYAVDIGGGLVWLARKGPDAASDSPLNEYERIIKHLCERVVELESEPERHEEEVRKFISAAADSVKGAIDDGDFQP